MKLFWMVLVFLTTLLCIYQNYVFILIRNGVSLNLDLCMFLVYLGVILGYIVSKERKLPNPNNIWIIVGMSPQPKTLCNIQVSKSPCSLLLMFNWTFYFHFEANHKVDAKIWSFKVDYQILNRMGDSQILIYIDAPDWDFKFHGHINISNLVVGMMLVALNVICFCGV